MFFLSFHNLSGVRKKQIGHKTSRVKSWTQMDPYKIDFFFFLFP